VPAGPKLAGLVELADSDLVAYIKLVTRDATGRPIASDHPWVRTQRMRLGIEVCTQRVADISPPKLASQVRR
jgi:hypothetical protein